MTGLGMLQKIQQLVGKYRTLPLMKEAMSEVHYHKLSCSL